ncbi:MAG: hypothetical protein J0H07_09015 [Sphingobacteriales bacterium]|nr:hypothetical protein [Sphingobacteriales bacterium]
MKFPQKWMNHWFLFSIPDWGIIKVIIAYYFKALPSKGVKHNSQSRRV